MADRQLNRDAACADALRKAIALPLKVAQFNEASHVSVSISMN
jgi:hypothetical protein